MAELEGQTTINDLIPAPTPVEVREPTDAEIEAFLAGEVMEDAGEDPDSLQPSTLGDAVLVGHFEDGSEAWHDARFKGIGGSEIASILGINNFKSRYVLWMEKAGIIPRNQDDNPLFEWGHRLEPVIIEKFAEAHPEYQVLPGGSWRNKDRPYQLANPDGRLINKETGEFEILEIKTSMTGVGWGPGPNDIPAKYVAQVRWYLDTFGWTSAHICVLIGLGDYREYRIFADPAKTIEMRDAAAGFAHSLQAGQAPPIDGGEDTYTFLRERNLSIVAKGEGSKVELDAELVKLVQESKAALAHAESEMLRAKGHLLAHMGTAKTAEFEGKVIAARQAKGEGAVPFVVLK
jgi:putative phage-type endonuclease